MRYSCLFIPAAIAVFIASCSNTAVKMNLKINSSVLPPCGGRAVAVTVDPVNERNVWVATPTGGLYESPDGGFNWAKVDAMPEFACYDIKFCPVPEHRNIIIATCLEDTRRLNAGGIWLSKDGGNTWKQPSTAKVRDSKKSVRRYGAYGISFMPFSQTVVVGTDSGVAISHDLGDTWQYVNPPGDNLPNKFYSVLALRGGELVCSGENAIWTSDITGTIWKADKAGLSYRKQVKNGLASAEVIPGNSGFHVLFFTGDEDHKLVYSKDDGLTWQNINVDFTGFHAINPDDTWRQPGLFVVKPDDADWLKWDLYFFDHAVVGKETITWNQTKKDFDFPLIPWTQLPFNHADPSDLAFSTDGANRLLYATNDGGVEASADNGSTWKQVGNTNNRFNALQVYDVKCIRSERGASVDPGIYFGTQDNSIYGSSDNGLTWPYIYYSEGGNLQGQLLKPGEEQPYALTLLAAASSPKSFERCNLQLASCAPVKYPFAGNVTGRNAIYAAGSSNYIALGVDVSNTSRLYTSVDNTLNWTSADPVVSFSHTVNLYGMVAGQTNPSVLTAYSNNFSTRPGASRDWGMLRIDNAFSSATASKLPQMVPLPGNCKLGTYGAEYRSDIASFGVDPTNPDFMILPDIGNRMVWISAGPGFWTPRQDIVDLITDNGKFEFSLAGFSPRNLFELSSAQVSCISFDPLNPNCIAIGTAEAGIILSTDHGATWKKIDGSERVPNITSFSFGNGVLYVSTWGAGIWEITI